MWCLLLLSLATAAEPPDVISPVATAAAGPDPTRLRSYRARRLVRQDLGVAGGWGVNDGVGASQTTAVFASRVGNRATAARLELDRRANATATAYAVALAGLGACVTAGGILSFPEPEAQGAEAAEAYDDALLATLFGGGLLLAATPFAIVLPVAGNRHRESVSSYYTREAADSWIAEHNRKLREELGLSEADVRGIESGARAPRAGPTVALGVGPAALTLRATF